MVWVPVVHHGLEPVRGPGAKQQKEGKGRAADPADVKGKGGEAAFLVPADAAAGKRPGSGQGSQPGKPHVSHRAEDPEIGKIIRQGPDAGIEPAKLPAVRPDGQAQEGKGQEGRKG